MIAQILLAAGKSTRMGYPKPLLDFDGTLLLDLMLQQCRRAAIDQIFVVLGHLKERVSEAVDLTGVTVVANEEYERGQTHSLQCALAALPGGTKAFINLPVDHPLVTYREIDALVEAFRKRADVEKIFVPYFREQEGRPVLFDISMKDSIAALPPGAPVNSLFSSVRMQRVPIHNPYTMLDADTPAQYRQCLDLFRTQRQIQPS